MAIQFRFLLSSLEVIIDTVLIKQAWALENSAEYGSTNFIQ